MDTTVALFTRAQSGDTEAFTQLYEEFFTPIYRYILFRVKHVQTAEDLTQTVFLKIFRSLDTLTHNTYPKAYFFTVAKHTIIDHWKKKKDIVFDETSSVFTQIKSEEDPSKDVDHMFSQEQIQKLLDEIDTQHSELLYLKFIEQLENKEIAVLLGKKEDAIRQMQCRALKAVRKHMHKKNISTSEPSLL